MVGFAALEYGAWCLTDREVEGLQHPQHRLRLEEVTPDAGPVPQIDAAQSAVVLFTSGSTGKAQPNAKSWGRLAAGIRIGMRRFGLDNGRHHLVATVPPQHMFGLEFTILYPLLGPSTVHAGRPFYPEDVRAALEQVAAPRVLITTPVHLRACAAAGLEWAGTDFVISSTAPLASELAQQSEDAFDCPVYEIYGSSETGAVARRRTARERLWQLHEGMSIIPVEASDDWLLHGPQLETPQAMADRIALHEDGRFEWLGRKADLVNIAGKRAALGDLNHRLLAIDGVEDG
ncbi:MAG: AMP-binding protein, partial [Gammaproteobacteria bacterium]